MNICGQLHYAKAGSGEQLLLLGETPRGYRFFEPILPPLALHFHVIALDLPGLWKLARAAFPWVCQILL